jgi:predicted nucleic acid-binding protein
VAGAPEPAGDPPGGWLLDTSARWASPEPEAAAALRRLLATGRLVTCPLLDLEALEGPDAPAEPAGAAGSADRREALARRHLAYRRVPLDDVVTARALALQARPVARGDVPARSWLLVATAAVHRLGVLHDDAALGRVAAAYDVPQRPVSGLTAGNAA